MNNKNRLIVIFTVFAMLVTMIGCEVNQKQQAKKVESNLNVEKPMNLQIIIGSIRPTGTAQKIANNIKLIIDKRPEIKSEIVNLIDYNLPFYTDIISPASREGEITDPILKKWADKIKQANAYIIISPEYNSGYPASLKNALDSLYKEWNNKPVAIIGYSGGSTGGSSMIAQLKQVAQGLEMIPVSADVKIPQSWKAFNKRGELANIENVESQVNTVLDQLLLAKK